MKWSISLTLGLLGSLAAAQDTASQTSASTAATTTSADQSSTTDSSNSNLIQSLLSGAESLLSSAYPSTTLTQVASLTWPSAVVIGGSTYSVTSASASSTLATSVSPSATNDKPIETSAAASTQNIGTNSDKDDKRIGIIVGVVLGCVALGLLLFMLWWVRRRNKRTGTFFRHRPASATDSEIQHWRSPTSSTTQFPEKYATLSAPPPPMPMAARHWSNGETISTDRSQSSANPFYTPHESHAELAANSSRRNSAHSLHELRGDGPRQASNDNRPSTPFSPAAMMAMMSASGPVSPISPSEEHQNHSLYRPMEDYRNPFEQNTAASAQPMTHEHHQPQHHEDYANPYAHRLSYPRTSTNPFAHEDDEEEDVFDTPPRIPTRSPNRNSASNVHYPSGPELSTFDFGLQNGRREWGSEEQIDGGDGWRRQRPGPHELE